MDLVKLAEQMNAQMATVGPAVQVWMNWMIFCFLGSILFVKSYKTARYVFAALLISMPLGPLVFHYTGTVHLLGIVHWLVWAPLGFYIYNTQFKNSKPNFKSPYGTWITLLLTTIIICLSFDIWDFYQVWAGNK